MKNFLSGVIALIAVASFFGGIGWLVFAPTKTEGVVVNVEYPNASFGNRGNRVRIVFEDGRQLYLMGTPSVSIIKGKKYRVSYNNAGAICGVEELDGTRTENLD